VQVRLRREAEVTHVLGLVGGLLHRPEEEAVQHPGELVIREPREELLERARILRLQAGGFEQPPLGFGGLAPAQADEAHQLQGLGVQGIALQGLPEGTFRVIQAALDDPQVAQVAIQQAQLLAGNLGRMKSNKPLKEFRYKDLGTMATVGRNLAVVELPSFRFQGVFAWFVWMFIHLMSIIGVKNKLLIFINWAWKYFTYDQSTRLILRPKGCAGISTNNYSMPE